MKLISCFTFIYLVQMSNGDNVQEQIVRQQPVLQPQQLGLQGQPNLVDLFRGAATSFSQALISLLNFKLRWISQIAATMPAGSAGTPGLNIAATGTQGGVNNLLAPLVAPQNTPQTLAPMAGAPAIPLVNPQLSQQVAPQQTVVVPSSGQPNLPLTQPNPQVPPQTAPPQTVSVPPSTQPVFALTQPNLQASQQVAPQQTGSVAPSTQPVFALTQPNLQASQQVAPQQTGSVAPSTQPVFALTQPNPQTSPQLTPQSTGPANNIHVTEHLTNYHTGLATGGLDTY